MYGSNEKPSEELALVIHKGKDQTLESSENIETFLRNPYEEDWNEFFWKEVTDLYGDGESISWSAALNKIRIKNIKERYIADKKDPLVAIITEVYDKFKRHIPITDQQKIASFQQQLSKFANILLTDDFNAADDNRSRTYTKCLQMPDGNRKTILHLAAERDLLQIAKDYVKFYKGYVYEPTEGEGLDKIPLELAITNGCDNTASFLVKNMLNSRVRALFESDAVFDARLKFACILANPTLKKTVVALLDCCINPDWPYVPVEGNEKKEEAWSRIDDLPLRYHFYYRMLDSDAQGEPPKVKDSVNDNFNGNLKSCLQLLIDGPHGESVISHPVIRMLVNRKWDKFGRKHVLIRLFMYLVFVVVMSVAFLIDKENNYLSNINKSPKDTLRLICEIATSVFAVIYLLVEFDQMDKERMRYLKDPYNYLDLTGIMLLLLLIPLGLSDHLDAQNHVAALAYLVNCLRVFKYFPAFKEIGIYSKTFARIIYKDILKFALIFLIVLFAFTGSVFIVAKAQSNDGSSFFFAIVLREVRALAEGNPFDDDYDSYRVGVIILIMVNMFTIIVILSNILIGQLSYRYEIAIEEAEIQFSIDKAKFISSIESGFMRLKSLRVQYYTEGDFVSDEDLVAELLQDWTKLQTKTSSHADEAMRFMKNNYAPTTTGKTETEELLQLFQKFIKDQKLKEE